MAKLGDHRFPISSTEHQNSYSILFGKPNTKIILYSDGKIETEISNKLLDESSKIVLDLSAIDAIEYSRGIYKNKFLFKSLNLLTLFSSFAFLFSIGLIIEFFTTTIPLDLSTLLVLSLPILWVFSDLFRKKFATPETITFIKKSNAKVSLHGPLPGDLHAYSTFMFFLMFFMLTMGYLNWTAEQNPSNISNFIFLLIGLIILFFFLSFIVLAVKYYFSDETKSQEVKLSNIPNDFNHLYFACLSFLKPYSGFSQEAIEDKQVELERIKTKLEQHEKILSEIISADSIFTAPSASMGVLAVRISTEAIMKNACDIKGATWKKNARPTLSSYLQRYRSIESIDSKIESNVNNIIQLGNRAAHDFNLDWQEFYLVVNQFSEIVTWYSSIYHEK